MKTFPLLLFLSVLLLGPFHVRAMFEIRDDAEHKGRPDESTTTQRNSERVRIAAAQQSKSSSSGTMTVTVSNEDSSPLQDQPSSTSSSSRALGVSEIDFPEKGTFNRKVPMEQLPSPSIATDILDSRLDPSLSPQEVPLQGKQGRTASGVSIEPVTTKKIVPTERVRFSDSLAAEETKGMAESFSKFSKKVLSADAASDAEFERRTRQFKKLVAGLEIAIDEISEDDAQRTEKIVATFETATPQIKFIFQKLLEAAPEKDSRPARVARVYAAATPEVKEYLLSLLDSMVDDVNPQSGLREIASAQGNSFLPAAKLLELNFILATIKAECDQISEEDPEHSSKVAAAYAAGYPKLKMHLESFLAALNRNPSMYDQKAALQLGASALQLFETAFQSIDRTKITPIEVPYFGIDYLLAARKIPQISVGEKRIDPETKAFNAAVSDAEATTNNLKELLDILRASDENIRELFFNHLFFKAHRKSFPLSRKRSDITDQLVELELVIKQEGLSSERLEAREALINERIFLRKETEQNREVCARIEEAQKNNEMKIEPSEARKEALVELISLARESIIMSAEVVLLASQRTPQSLL